MAPDDNGSGDDRDAELQGGRSQRSPVFFYAICLAAAVLATYLSAIPGEFVWLDHAEIQSGGYRIQGPDDFWAVWTQSLERFMERREGTLEAKGGYWRPLYACSISLDWRLWGNQPWLYHIENIVWHLAVVMGLFLLGRRLLVDELNAVQVAFWAALLFAVHPLNAQSVTWISGRKDAMCASLGVASLLAFGQAVTGSDSFASRWRALLWPLLSVAAFAAAAACKELALVVPLFATLWLWHEQGRQGRLGGDSESITKWAWPCVAALWVTAGTLLLVRWRVLGDVGLASQYPAESFAANVATSACLWWYYLGKLFFPFFPTISDRWPVVVTITWVEAAALLGLVPLLAGLVFGFRRWTLLSGILWFVVWMIPAMGLIPLRHLYAERYLYPASWGILLVAVSVFFRGLSWDDVFEYRVRCGLLLLLILGFAGVTFWQNAHWWSDERLFSRAVEQDPQYVEGRLMLASLALDKGDYNEALEQSRHALAAAADTTQASYFPPFIAHTNLGLAYYYTRQYQEADEQFRAALDSRPRNAIAHYHLGLNAQARNDLSAAEQLFLTALQYKPDDFLTRSNLAFTYLRMGKLTDSKRLLRTLVQEQPDDLTNRANYGAACLVSGEYREAERNFQHILSHRPLDAVHLAKLAWAQWKLGKTNESVAHLAKAQLIQPDHPTVRHVRKIVEQESRQAESP